MSLEQSRIAEVWASGEQGGMTGSGYLVCDRYILTAAHVVEPSTDSPRGVCEVRCLGQSDWLDARVAWRHATFDVALLEVTGASGQAVSPVRYGRIVGIRSVPCTAVGFPDAQARPTGVRDTEQLDGDIRPLATVKAHQVTIHLRGSAPRDAGAGRTLWAGMSGAAVFAEGVLVGVVEFDPATFGTDRLVATPISLVGSDPEALAAFARAGIELQLDDIPAIPGLTVWAGRRGGATRSSPSLLLRSDRAVVPFRGRQTEMDGLREWCTRGEALVRLLIGPAGTGKTRLAGEVCRRLADVGWRTGFIGDRAPDDVVKLVSELGQPALLVIDYAETRAGLHDLLARMVDIPREPRLRVLLLARSAGDWWQTLQAASAEMEEVLLGAEVQLLGAVDTTVMDRVASFGLAADAFLSEQGMQPRVVAAPDLSGREFEAILFVHMAALDAVGTPDDPAPGPSTTGHVPVLEATRRREMRYWIRSARAKGLAHADTVLERAVALATLIGADDEGEAAAVLLRVPDLEDASQERRRALARWYHDLYPGSEWLGPVQPDALAEEITAHVFADSFGLARIAFRELPAARAHQALTILDRTARRRPELERALEEVLGSDLEGLARGAVEVAMQTGDPIGRVLARVLGARPDAALALADLIEEIPAQTVALREVAERLAGAAVVNARASGSPTDLARSLNNLSVRLADLGRREDALVAVQEAVDLDRERVAAARPDAFRPDLAMALNNLSGRLADLGRREDALAASMEAVDVYRELAASRPDGFRPNLASALNNLSVRLADLGRREDALAASKEAVDVYRELVAARPDGFHRDLATALNNLSNRLSDLGRREDALAASKEAVDVYRELAVARPDAIRPALAMALNNLSGSLSNLGRREEALAASKEAVAFRRELAAARPDAFRPDLASALNNLSNDLSELGRREDALTVIQEAVDIYRDLVAARPDAFRHKLAMALNNLSNRLSDLGRREDALTVIQEAVDVYRELAAARPDAFRPDLATALNNLALRLADLGRHENALAASQEAVDVYR